MHFSIGCQIQRRQFLIDLTVVNNGYDIIKIHSAQNLPRTSYIGWVVLKEESLKLQHLNTYQVPSPQNSKSVLFRLESLTAEAQGGVFEKDHTSKEIQET